jgi:hypothetical protein
MAERGEGGKRASNSAATKAAAASVGRDMARDRNVEHHIHKLASRGASSTRSFARWWPGGFSSSASCRATQRLLAASEDPPADPDADLRGYRDDHAWEPVRHRSHRTRGRRRCFEHPTSSTAPAEGGSAVQLTRADTPGVGALSPVARVCLGRRDGLPVPRGISSRIPCK